MGKTNNKNTRREAIHPEAERIQVPSPMLGTSPSHQLGGPPPPRAALLLSTALRAAQTLLISSSSGSAVLGLGDSFSPY